MTCFRYVVIFKREGTFKNNAKVLETFWVDDNKATQIYEWNKGYAKSNTEGHNNNKIFKVYIIKIKTFITIFK